MIAGPGNTCSISREGNIWSSCVVQVLICDVQKKKIKCFYTLFTLWFCKLWFNFGSILSRFSTRLLLLAKVWLVHTSTFVFVQPIRIALFSFNQSRLVGMLQCYIPAFPFHSSTYIHAPTTVSPGGHRSSVGREHRCSRILFLFCIPLTTPPSFSPLYSNHICASESTNTLKPCSCRSHSCQPMIFAAFTSKLTV